MSALLKTGTYFGRCAQAYSCSQAVLTEVAHSAARCLPEHSHERAYISLLIAGSYAEHVQGTEFSYRPMDAVFHPLGTPHRDIVGNNGARFVCVEFLQTDLAGEINAGGWRAQRLQADMAVLMLRLYQHWRAGTLCPATMESGICELLGTLGNSELKHERRLPPWLRECLDHIEAQYQTSITVADLARQVDIHPVHLAREFRRRFGETLGEYVNRIRIKAACRQLLGEKDTIVDAAMACGFYDHSHFLRVFKATVGCTPSSFQRSHRAVS